MRGTRLHFLQTVQFHAPLGLKHTGGILTNLGPTLKIKINMYFILVLICCLAQEIFGQYTKIENKEIIEVTDTGDGTNIVFPNEPEIKSVLDNLSSGLGKTTTGKRRNEVYYPNLYDIYVRFRLLNF